eukprot:COSAG06_NODE_44_length_29699_cov_231.744527_29_plen_33_part_00
MENSANWKRPAFRFVAGKLFDIKIFGSKGVLM